MFATRRFTSRVVIVAIFLALTVFYLVSNFAFTGIGQIQTAAKEINLNQRLKQRSEVDLVVVEEHHEVLEYWFEAANKGIIPKSGNVLLHIDAHSDMAPPEIVENYPLFRWPKNKVEIKVMMQSNDVFIQAAAMSGLFKKVIWVWPSWDEESHDSDDLNRYFGGGWTFITVNGEKEKALCECEIKKDGITKNECQYINKTSFSVDENYDGTEMDPKECTIEGKIKYQEIVDYNALNKVKSAELVQEGESLLLDIDQDFFGCVLRGKSLIDAGISWDVVEEIDELLEEVFCPKVIEHEELSNDLMQRILSLIVKKCKKSEKNSKACVTPQDRVYKEFTSDLNKILKLSSSQEIFCEMEKESRESKLSLLIEAFVQLNLQQLKALTNTGFCMQTSHRSYSSPGFQLCHGANEPNSTMVTVHMPGKNELQLRLNRLRRIIQAKSYPVPQMVTLCRSIRDGYTPVSYFAHIEKHVIESVRKSKAGVNFNIIYDQNLLAGKKGWPARQKKYNLSKPTKRTVRRRRP